MMMMMMKNPIILVTCVLLSSSLAVPEILCKQGTLGPDDCCLRFFSTRLPKNSVVSYKYTEKGCLHKAVLFTMRNGAKICVNPSEKWVKNIIKTKHWIQKVNSSGSKQSDLPNVCFITTL
ncbi:C-C motif chemokine 4-like [Micropterus dolomieu]|uniref:C-C motif chemokine 4-like n=1 Tax=Micropterus dolomieu TaxID=147949 RepID=UPI001E8D010C|nr:C-C motif chemokine 4-like [Micropterus dolomieu]